MSGLNDACFQLKRVRRENDRANFCWPETRTKYAYDAYGQPAESSWTGSRFRYTGQMAIPEAQLYYYKARMYSPSLGRFLQTDPIGGKDDLNLYSYVGDDPADKTDPSGLDGGCIYTPGQCGGLAPAGYVMGATEGAALLLGTAGELGAGDAIVGTARGLAGAVKTRPFWAVIVRFGLGQLNHAAEKAAEQGSEQVLKEATERVFKQEMTEAAQSQIDKVAEKGTEEGKLIGQSAIKAGEKIVNSIAGMMAAKGVESVKASSNGTITGKYTPIGSRIFRTVTCSANTGQCTQ